MQSPFYYVRQTVNWYHITPYIVTNVIVREYLSYYIYLYGRYQEVYVSMEIDCGQAVDVLWSTNSSFLGAVLNL